MPDEDDENGPTADSEVEALFAPEDVTWRDYVAISVAMAQTVLLPFLLASLVLLVLFVLSIYLT